MKHADKMFRFTYKKHLDKNIKDPWQETPWPDKKHPWNGI